MTWNWRGIYYPCTYQEYNMVLSTLQSEKGWNALTSGDKEQKLRHALDVFCQKTYHQKQCTIEQLRQSVICQRENPFYVDTVRNFRNRRYIYKKEQKKAGIKAAEYDKLLDNPDLTTAQRRELSEKHQFYEGLVLLNESLQLAHKAILNSFYGYAMRTGSRWFSMQMAACVTFVGSNIIRRARVLVGKIGIPLELDTDGIWSMLPCTFPDEFCFQTTSGKMKFKYPEIMLNAMTASNFTNKQF